MLANRRVLPLVNRRWVSGHLKEVIAMRREFYTAYRYSGCCLRGRKETRCRTQTDRKSTRLNSSHTVISYAVFCLKKKNKTTLDGHSPVISNYKVVASDLTDRLPDGNYQLLVNRE